MLLRHFKSQYIYNNILPYMSPKLDISCKLNIRKSFCKRSSHSTLHIKIVLDASVLTDNEVKLTRTNYLANNEVSRTGKISVHSVNAVFKHGMFIPLYIVITNIAKRHGKPCFLSVQ